jgi:hypothetical protein
MGPAALVFTLLVVYQVKHFLADFVLQQNDYMLGKFKPGWDWVGPLLAHIGVHAAMTLVIGMVLLPSTMWGWAFLVAEFDAVIHATMDRIKAAPHLMGRWKALTGPEYMEAKVASRMSCVDLLEVRKAGNTKYTNPWNAEKDLRNNALFWCALGFDQMVHHLTHYGCVWIFLKLYGVL